MDWYQKSAKAGSARGMNNIGWLYQKGLGVTVDYPKAMDWYKKGLMPVMMLPCTMLVACMKTVTV